ncbi:ABC transporter ATP-binding protein [Mycoplasma zalophidermidis]|uniref:ABC transporter ATP-binding protein/permease n=1 Tax=Mycoplasma zalophidermidis TaxID=398174 RepID=A0ABS6DQL7_9MOLU|nr:ABC transporter ATP-binding protein [Mycoplasma zalophidermidis]MBU4690030.1 ABC transporter ATP-binding protein/permease [Mycoplasma zalophidermidis]MBU4693298.1 ABC transporter ATP-binding protein/permease [Mycoplasma zalophidermidis]MCR8966406.1 ABC transporter ATP-binding protein/permease [Mycoplasma zalophidermidis]
MIKMLKMLPKKIKFTFISGAIIAFVAVIVSLLLPNFISQFIRLIFDDKELQTIELLSGKITLFKDKPRNEVRDWLIIMIAIQTAITALLTFAFTAIFVYAAEQCSYFYRMKLYDKINSLSLKNISDLKPESIMTKISNDVAVFWDFLVVGFSTMIRGFMMIVGGIIMAFMVNTTMALVITPVIPGLLILITIIGKITSPLIKKTQKNLEYVTKNIDENIKGSRTIKTYNLENKRSKQFSGSNETWYKLSVKFNSIISILHPVFYTLINFVVIGIFMVIRHQTLEHVATATDLVNMNIFIEYLWTIGFGIILLTVFIIFGFKARVSAGRLMEIFNAKADKLYVENGIRISDISNKNNLNYDLNIKNLNFKYYQDNPNYALTDINLNVPFKSSLGIIGLFASGKSTLVSLLLNNYVYNEGSITIGGHEVNQINTKQLLDTVGIVYQDPMLYSGTIKSNMLWAKPDATDEEINLALKNACAYDFVYKFDDNLNHPVTQGATNLSGGQKQRISIARTLLRKPKILILDDSTSALDNITTKTVINNIIKNYDCSTILISQKIGALKNCDKIAVMDSGHIIDQGSHEHLVKNCPFYKQIHQNQLEQ